MAIREGAWDCSQCNTRGIAGGVLNCPLCGDARNTLLDPTERTYLPTNARIVTDTASLRRARSGPVWNCGKCGQANPYTGKACTNCKEARDTNDDVAGRYTYVSGVAAKGASLSYPGQIDADRVDAVLQSADRLQPLADGPVRMPDRTFSGSALPRSSTQEPPSENSGYSTSVSQLWSNSRFRRIGLIAVAAVVLVFGGQFAYANFIQTHAVSLTVDSLSWERQIEIEELQTLTQEDWSVPAGGRVISQREEIRSYNRVIDHYEDRVRQVAEQVKTGSHEEEYACGSTTVDLGNGYYDEETTYCSRMVDDYTTVYHDEPYKEAVYREDPVYGTKYTYQVDQWVTDHFARASGETEPTWPIPDVVGDKQRVGDERRQTYAVVLIDAEGQRHTRTLDETDWSHLDEGEILQGEMTRTGSLRGVDWPES